MLAQDAALQRIALLAAHRSDVKRVGARYLIRRLLQLASVDQLHVSHRRSSRFPRVLVVEPAPKSGQHGRKIIVESLSRTLATLRNARDQHAFVGACGPGGRYPDGLWVLQGG